MGSHPQLCFRPRREHPKSKTMSQAPEPGCSNCCGLCGDNCHCQKGVSGVLIGAFIVVAAGVFTFFTTFIDIFPWQWYRDLCLFWFLLGCLIFCCGWVHIALCGCDRTKAREAEEPLLQSD